ncbi:hypothetical protein GCM10010324_06290 [Streptomyces hiroshimensis]|uniref:Uncharacterized protein n=1 Tax=Streptomyces hiroshimensis TaxID=66424 RepID=A0ABQ2Y4Q6_9ACTN|nr:hypothetical protein GCM10010324_06290 [Streptomyces hiroshimensis]
MPVRERIHSSEVSSAATSSSLVTGTGGSALPTPATTAARVTGHRRGTGARARHSEKMCGWDGGWDGSKPRECSSDADSRTALACRVCSPGLTGR